MAGDDRTGSGLPVRESLDSAVRRSPDLIEPADGTLGFVVLVEVAPMPDRAERRQFGRYLIVLPLLYKSPGIAAARVSVGWTRNLGEGGACVELPERLPIQNPLAIRLQTDRGLIAAEARVVWAGEPAPGGGGIRHGLHFTRLAARQQRTLQDMLYTKGEKRLAGMRLPFEVAVTCQPKGSAGSPVLGRTGNVSRGGILLCLPEAFPPETILALTLQTPYGPLAAEGAVVWVEPEARRRPGELIRHGLRFIVLGWSTSLSLGLSLVDTQEPPPGS